MESDSIGLSKTTNAIGKVTATQPGAHHDPGRGSELLNRIEMLVPLFYFKAYIHQLEETSLDQHISSNLCF